MMDAAILIVGILMMEAGATFKVHSIFMSVPCSISAVHRSSAMLPSFKEMLKYKYNPELVKHGFTDWNVFFQTLQTFKHIVGCLLEETLGQLQDESPARLTVTTGFWTPCGAAATLQCIGHWPGTQRRKDSCSFTSSYRQALFLAIFWPKWPTK